MWLTLRMVTPSLPAGARILDVEPSTYTQRWFGRFNQFDYRTLGAGPEMDYQTTINEVKLPQGVCHLVVCSAGIGQPALMTETAAMLRRITGEDGRVLVQLADEPSDETVSLVTQHLQHANFTVVKDTISEHLAPAEVAQFGIHSSGSMLVCVPVPLADAPKRNIMGHHH